MKVSLESSYRRKLKQVLLRVVGPRLLTALYFLATIASEATASCLADGQCPGDQVCLKTSSTQKQPAPFSTSEVNSVQIKTGGVSETRSAHGDFKVEVNIFLIVMKIGPRLFFLFLNKNARDYGTKHLFVLMG